MAAPFKSMGKKRALLIAIRSVLGSDLPYLKFAHRDAKELRGRLIEYHGYQPEDIILMLDDRNHPRELWPTRHNILDQIGQLTHDVPEDCHFCFYFSGHGLEEECCDCTRMKAGGRDDEIVCADGRPILDRILHDRLITPLEKVKGSTLFAIFDCCHSETLLDLQRGKGPNCYSREWNIGRDQLFRAVSISIVIFLQLSKRHRHNDSSRAPRRMSTIWSSEATSEVHEVGELSVICLSACRDKQSAHDDRDRELTFTKCFMDAMAEKPNITWTELRDTLKRLVWQIRTQYDSYEQGEPWEQDPRISTNSSTTNLSKPVTETL